MREIILLLSLIFMGCSSGSNGNEQNQSSQGLITVASTSDITNGLNFKQDSSVQFSYHGNYFELILSNYRRCSGKILYSNSGSSIALQLPTSPGDSVFWSGASSVLSECLPRDLSMKVEFVSQDLVYNYYRFYLPLDIFQVVKTR